MKTELHWHPPTDLPEGDVYTALLALEEPNPNQAIEEKMGIPTGPTKRYIASAIFNFNTQEFMTFGEVIPKERIYAWASPDKWPT